MHVPPQTLPGGSARLVQDHHEAPPLEDHPFSALHILLFAWVTVTSPARMRLDSWSKCLFIPK